MMLASQYAPGVADDSSPEFAWEVLGPGLVATLALIIAAWGAWRVRRRWLALVLLASGLLALKEAVDLSGNYALEGVSRIYWGTLAPALLVACGIAAASFYLWRREHNLSALGCWGVALLIAGLGARLGVVRWIA
jgi:hypothetical protein